MLKDPSLASRALGVRQKQIVVTCNYPARARCLQATMAQEQCLYCSVTCIVTCNYTARARYQGHQEQCLYCGIVVLYCADLKYPARARCLQATMAQEQCLYCTVTCIVTCNYPARDRCLQATMAQKQCLYCAGEWASVWQ